MKKESQPTQNQKKEDKENFKELLLKRTNQLSTLILILVVLLILFSSIISTQEFICGSCHAIKENFESLEKSTHAKVACLSCHKEEGYFSFLTLRIRALSNLLNSLSGNYELPLTDRINNKECLFCHPAILEKVIESGRIKVSHKEFTKKSYLCTDCHGNIAHETKGRVRNYPNMDRCFRCHNNDSASAECELCHLENVWRKTTFTVNSPYQIAHATPEKKLHGMLPQSLCAICHSDDFCQNCHKAKLPHPDNWFNLHGISSQKNKDCYTCHNEEYCNKCHIVPMPHPDTFLIEHGDIAEDIGENICLTCHIDETCNFCHVESVHKFLGVKYRIINGKAIRKKRIE